MVLVLEYNMQIAKYCSTPMFEMCLEEKNQQQK